MSFLSGLFNKKSEIPLPPPPQPAPMPSMVQVDSLLESGTPLPPMSVSALDRPLPSVKPLPLHQEMPKRNLEEWVELPQPTHNDIIFKEEEHSTISAPEQQLPDFTDEDIQSAQALEQRQQESLQPSLPPVQHVPLPYRPPPSRRLVPRAIVEAKPEEEWVEMRGAEQQPKSEMFGAAEDEWVSESMSRESPPLAAEENWTDTSDVPVAGEDEEATEMEALYLPFLDAARYLNLLGTVSRVGHEVERLDDEGRESLALNEAENGKLSEIIDALGAVQDGCLAAEETLATAER